MRSCNRHPTDQRSVCSTSSLPEMLTGAIQEVSNQLNINEGFLGLIVLPIAGNVTEHLTVGCHLAGCKISAA